MVGGEGEQLKAVVKKAAAVGEDAAIAVNQHFLFARPVFRQVNHGDATAEQRAKNAFKVITQAEARRGDDAAMQVDQSPLFWR